ncbi:SDR family oxidoreductase [Ornithinicoccus halotolerans]|uniref:SDR family oxidoreductase n=1 Tax=Ornithinicoccus halotolerans TaxID=1748220 RepID=UPI00188624FB|nr:NAD(P)H-binding protein [Ornithinicoccus halotolerans]
MRLAVVGATGTAGRHVQELARSRGHEVVPIARSLGIDAASGRGLAKALAGVEAVVDVTNRQSQRRGVAERALTAAARTLQRVGAEAGVGHHVLVSIVGVDRPGVGKLPYYRAKRVQEQEALAGPLPVTVLRTTQWFEFADTMLQLTGRGPVVLAPRMPRLQPVAVRAVAARLVDLAETGPPDHGATAARVELAGPAELSLRSLVTAVLTARRDRRLLVEVPFPAPRQVRRAIAEGGLLPGPSAERDSTTLDAWLRGQ